MATAFEYEQRVQHFLTENKVTFVAQHYEIPYSKDLDSGGSSPDFIAIRPGSKECFVVEVSVSGKLDGLLAKINNRDKHWLVALQSQLNKHNVIDEHWLPIEILVFIRKDKIQWFKKRIKSSEGVHIWPVEYTLEHWLWPSEVRSASFDLRKTELAPV